MKKIFRLTLILCLVIPFFVYAIDGSNFDADDDGDVDAEDLAGFAEYFGTLRWYKDFDEDSHSDGTTQYSTSQPNYFYPESELINLFGDCDDENPNINPEADEECHDGVDNNCDGEVDEGCTCVTPGDCPVDPTPVCDRPSLCQGYRLEATCIDNECGTIQVDDDSACDQGIIANQCNLYPEVYCAGGEDQVPPACQSFCLNDSDCDEEGFCLNGLCEPDLPAGNVCIIDAQCASGYCVDGVCCDGPCSGTCRACTSALTGYADGTCAFIPNGNDPQAECPDGPCDGNGQCAILAPNGVACGSSNQCASGYCVDGVCCDGPCSGNCQSCLSSNTSFPDGVCAFILDGTDPEAECPGGWYCDGNGGCTIK